MMCFWHCSYFIKSNSLYLTQGNKAKQVIQKKKMDLFQVWKLSFLEFF